MTLLYSLGNPTAYVDVVRGCGALKTETGYFTDKMVSTYESTRRYNKEQQQWHVHRRENFRFPRCYVVT
jgi:hypothetical protein